MPAKNAPLRIDLSGFIKKNVTMESLMSGLDLGRQARNLMDSDARKGLMDFTKLPGDRKLLRMSTDLAKELSRGVDDLIVCGIGGSALGFLALVQALLHPFHNELSRSKRGAPRYFLLDNADAETVSGALDLVNLNRALVVVISKSGSGGETIANFFVVLEALVKKLRGNFKKALQKVVVITDPEKGPLRKFALEYGVRSLPVPPNVGGRFSVLAPVGIFPAAMLGIDVASLMSGAGAMLKRCTEPDMLKNPAMTLALLLNEHYSQGRKITVFMPYANALWRTADWFRQLWAESLGKAATRAGTVVHDGMTPMAALGATDQHSQVQLYAEGPDDKTYIFLRTASPRKLAIPKPRFGADAYGFLGGRTLDELLNIEGDATQAALAHFGRPTARIDMPGTTAHALGQVLMLLEMTTACVGALWNINTFDQPGVELGKILTACGMGQKSACEKVIDVRTGVKAKDIMPRKGKASGAIRELIF